MYQEDMSSSVDSQIIVKMPARDFYDACQFTSKDKYMVQLARVHVQACEFGTRVYGLDGHNMFWAVAPGKPLMDVSFLPTKEMVSASKKKDAAFVTVMVDGVVVSGIKGAERFGFDGRDVGIDFRGPNISDFINQFAPRSGPQAAVCLDARSMSLIAGVDKSAKLMFGKEKDDPVFVEFPCRKNCQAAVMPCPEDE